MQHQLLAQEKNFSGKAKLAFCSHITRAYDALLCILVLIACHRNNSQSEKRKALVYTTAYTALIVLAAVFSMEWYRLVCTPGKYKRFVGYSMAV